MNDRLDDMLFRYGEVCSQKTAARILSVTPRTISRMMDDGRLRRVGMRVDVRSICRYIENPAKLDFDARIHKKHPEALSFYAASRPLKNRPSA